MHFQTFHTGSDELDPLALMAQRESKHCESIGVPFLSVPKANRLDEIWAYLWPADRVSAEHRANIGDWTAQYYVLLVDQNRFLGTVGAKLIPYHADFKDWHAQLHKAAIHWALFPDEELVLA